MDSLRTSSRHGGGMADRGRYSEPHGHRPPASDRLDDRFDDQIEGIGDRVDDGIDERFDKRFDERSDGRGGEPDGASGGRRGAHATRRARWPWAGLVAAVGGAAGSFVLGWDPSEEATRAGSAAIIAEATDHRHAIMIGASVGFASVLALLVFTAGFGRLAARRAPDSIAVTAMRMAFTAALGCLMFSFGLKHALAGGIPGGIDASFYTRTDVEVLGLVVSQMQYAAWWGVIAAAACAAVLALRTRVLPRWFGVVSAVLATVSIGATLAVGLPYSAGLLGPVWLAAASVAALRTSDA